MEELLYHYTGQNGFLGIIENKNIWASNIHYLNDSKEFIHAIDETKTMIWRRKKDQGNKNLVALYEEIESRLSGVSKINIFVVSLTEKGDLLSQWRGYCSNGPGYSIGFSKSEISNLSEHQGFAFNQCIYDWQQQRQVIDAPLKRAEELVLSAVSNVPNIIDNAVNRFISEFVHIAPLLKHRAFSEEKEWRLVSGPVPCTDSRWKTRAGRSTIVPYIEFNLVTNDGSTPIRNIIVGPGLDKELSSGAISSFLEKNGIKKWCITFSEVPYRTA